MKIFLFLIFTLICSFLCGVHATTYSTEFQVTKGGTCGAPFPTFVFVPSSSNIGACFVLQDQYGNPLSQSGKLVATTGSNVQLQIHNSNDCSGAVTGVYPEVDGTSTTCSDSASTGKDIKITQTSPSVYSVVLQASDDGTCTEPFVGYSLSPTTGDVGDCLTVVSGSTPQGQSVRILSSGMNVALEFYNTNNCAGLAEPSSVVDGTSTTCADFVGTAYDILVEDISPGSIGGDPHFTPISENKTISKMKYTPKSKEDGIYNIFSNERFQWNSLFKKYNVLSDTIHLIYQFVTGEYFIIKSPVKNGENAKISFKIVTDKTKSKSLFLQPTINQLISAQEEQEKTKRGGLGPKGMRNYNQLHTIALDLLGIKKEELRQSSKTKSFNKPPVKPKKGLALPINGKKENKERSTSTMRKFIKSRSPIPFKMSNGNKRFFIFGEQHPEYFIETPNLYHVILKTPFLKIKTRVTFLDLSWRSDLSKEQKRKLNEKYPKYSFPFLDTKIEVIETEGMEDSHGILGQTMRPECPYKQPHDGCVSCFMKGEPKDYRIEQDNQFGTNFKFNKFK